MCLISLQLLLARVSPSSMVPIIWVLEQMCDCEDIKRTSCASALLCDWWCVFVPPVGQPGRLQQSLRDFQPDYFSLSEKPPEEFCLSPNVSTSSSSSCSSKSHISVDLTQKRGEACCGVLLVAPTDLALIRMWQRRSEKSKIFLSTYQVDEPFSFSFSQLFQVW